MTKKHPVHNALPKDHVSMGTRIGWGFGGLADNYIMNILNMIFLVLYVQYFKMPPVLAGLALALPRFVDAITDPLIGNISDNTRSRWGRRRPYMVVGAILSAILLPFFWMPPGGADNPIWWQNPAFIFVTVLGVFYAITYTLFVVPYTALGYELTSDYDEKTRVLAWRMYVGLFGSLTVPWVYKLAQNDSFANEAVGAIWVSIAFGVVIIITGLIPVFVCREREEVQKQETSPFLKSFAATMSNKAFLILLVAYIFIIIGLFSAGTLGAFLNIYYICGGNKDFGGLLVAVAGSLGALVSYLSMFLISAVSVRTGKKTGMILGLILALIGIIGGWFAMDPRWPMAQLITTVIACMGLQGCWLMVSSMVADVCDEDELKTGLRREGMFGAVNGFALKAALAVTALVGGILLQFSGFDAKGIDQFEARTIKEVIEPSRAWNIEDESFRKATETFELSCFRFIEISEDKSSIEGSKWTVLGRLLKGENVYFRWYDFENAILEYLQAVEAIAPSISPERDAKLEHLIEAARSRLFDDFEVAVGAVKSNAPTDTLRVIADYEAYTKGVQSDVIEGFDKTVVENHEALRTQTSGLLVTKAELEAYAETVRAGFLTDFAGQKDVALLMKVLIIGFQTVGLLIALAIFAFYPITRQRAEETRRLLDERKAAADAAE